MDSIIIDERTCNLQETMLNEIDQEANKILHEIQKKINAQTEKYKRGVIQGFSNLYNEKKTMEEKKAKLRDMKSLMDQNLNGLRRQYKLNETLDSSMLVSQISVKSQQNVSKYIEKQFEQVGNSDFRLSKVEKSTISTNVIKCTICSKTFTNLIGLGYHMKVVHKTSVLKSYKCIHCNSLEGNALCMARHLINAHGQMGILDGRNKKYYFEETSQKAYYEAELLKKHIQSNDEFCGFMDAGRQDEDLNLSSGDDSENNIQIM